MRHFGRRQGVLPADQSDDAGHGAAVVGRRQRRERRPNVVVSGWQVYDNKGRVVEKYEPFFAQGWDYQPPSDAQARTEGRDVLRPARAADSHASTPMARNSG